MPPISPDSPFQDALRVRPLFADKLSDFKSDFWERPHAPLREFFPGQAMVLEGLVREASTWAVPRADSDWRGLPVAHLLDHLTQNHRDFIGVLLPDMQGLFRARAEALDILEKVDEEVESVRKDVERFAADLRARIEEDERDLFPRVLRYEASLHDPRVDPEFNGGSLRKAVAYRTATAGHDLLETLEALSDRLNRAGTTREGCPWLSLLEDRLRELRDGLVAHERLKSEVLYPMALEAEKTLYNLSIGGTGRQAAAAA
jgi:iron-sulfur cluster repair protein YtfE (RIC family)